MGKNVLDWKVRRNLSENPKSSKEALSKAARSLFEADRPAEAVELAQKAGDQELLGSIKAAAAEEGNLFLYIRACQASGGPAAAAELKALADKAAAAGLSSYEARARELLAQGAKPA
jgi:hypothetical protein